MKHSMYEQNEICKEYKSWVFRTVKRDFPECDKKKLKELANTIELSGYWETDINRLIDTYDRGETEINRIIDRYNKECEKL